MADSTSPIQQITAGANADARINENFDAGSVAMLYGRRAAGTTGFTWAFYGGRYLSTLVANGTVTLTASSTNYVVANKISGAVSTSTASTNWDDGNNYEKLYKIVTGTGLVTSYEDHRQLMGGGGGGGGVTGFTSSLDVAAPNATVPVARLLATGAQTNIDVALQTKGTGAKLAQLPDSTATGGNKRGARAVDWATFRAAATQVASGADTTIAGGASHTASQAGDTVGGGQNNTASGGDSCVPGGSTNVASGGNSFAMGSSCTASGLASVAIGGSSTASGTHSWARGNQAHTRGLMAYDVFSAGRFSTNGDAQSGRQVLRVGTTDATVSTFTANLAGAGTTNQLVLANDSAMCVTGQVTARQSTGDAKGWTFSCVIKRGANAAATAMVAACTPTVVANDAGAAAWALTVDADTTNGGLRIRATGEAAKSIKWLAVLECAEVAG